MLLGDQFSQCIFDRSRNGGVEFDLFQSIAISDVQTDLFSIDTQYVIGVQGLNDPQQRFQVERAGCDGEFRDRAFKMIGGGESGCGENGDAFLALVPEIIIVKERLERSHQFGYFIIIIRCSKRILELLGKNSVLCEVIATLRLRTMSGDVETKAGSTNVTDEVGQQGMFIGCHREDSFGECIAMYLY
jgi:hypothetical protein